MMTQRAGSILTDQCSLSKEEMRNPDQTCVSGTTKSDSFNSKKVNSYKDRSLWLVYN